MKDKTQFKQLTFLKKLQYIWDYYRFPIIATIIIAVLIFSFVYQKLNKKNDVLGVICVNSNTSTGKDSQAIFDDFLEQNGYDTSSNQILLNTNIFVDVENEGLDYQSVSTLGTYFDARIFNVCFMDNKTFDHYADIDTFCDLRDFFDKESLEKYSEYIVYRQTDSGSIPCGFRISSESNNWLSSSGLYDSCTFGICNIESDKELVQKISGYIIQ